MWWATTKEMPDIASFANRLNDNNAFDDFGSWRVSFPFAEFIKDPKHRDLCAASIVMYMVFQTDLPVDPEVIRFLLSQGANSLLLQGEDKRTVIEFASYMVLRYRGEPEHAASTRTTLRLLLDDLKLLPGDLGDTAAEFLLGTSKVIRMAVTELLFNV